MDEERDDCCKSDSEECCSTTQQPDGCCNGLTVAGNVNDFSSGATVTFNTTGTYLYNTCDPKPKTKMKDIIIKEMDYGYLVKIGCQTLCIESNKKLLKALKKYMKDPEGVEQLHLQGEFMECLD